MSVPAWIADTVHDIHLHTNAARAEITSAINLTEKLMEMSTPLIFDSPVGSLEERAGDQLWPGDWYDATGFGVLYMNNSAYHTGVDLNRPAFKDSGQPVFAAANGIVVFAGHYAGWQQSMVVIKHEVEKDKFVWTRYAHLAPEILVARGDAVIRGQPLSVIGDYSSIAPKPDGPKNDHCHYDISIDVDLGQQPGYWPGLNLALVKATFVDPLAFTREHHRP